MVVFIVSSRALSILEDRAFYCPLPDYWRILQCNMKGSAMNYRNILVRMEGHIAVVTLNRPQALNALNSALMDELTVAIDGFEIDDQVRCIIITGSEKAFA